MGKGCFLIGMVCGASCLSAIEPSTLFGEKRSMLPPQTMEELQSFCVAEAGKPRSVQSAATPCSHGALQQVARWLILFHQEVISPVDGPRSHFKPSSSEYTKVAIEKYGFLQGFLLGCDRLMRENSDPWVYRTTDNGEGSPIKWNPVP